MKLSRGDRDVFGVGTIAFALLAMLFAFFALIIAAQAESRSNDAKARVARIEAAGVPLGNSVKVSLAEFTITPHPAVVKSGPVTFQVDNVGSITHEMVVVRASSPAALPRVTKKGERAIGDVNEAAFVKTDTVGETGDVPARTHTTKVFVLTPGTYVMFCNIDNKAPGSAVLSHFQHGMSATLIVG